MAQALSICGLTLEGAHHRALDDTRNIARMLPFSKHAKASDAWARKLPHVFLTVNEFASYSYHTNGSPFGKPSPRWVVHANQDHFPTGVAHHHQPQKRCAHTSLP